MTPKIVAFLYDETLAKMARDMAPPGFDLRTFTDYGPESRAALKDADYLVGAGPNDMNDAFYQANPRLRLVQLLSAGYDRYDIEAARRAGVPISNNGGANSIAVAEHTIMLMLAVKRHLLHFHQNVLSGRWMGLEDLPPVIDLNGLTLGIIGLGTIGKRVSRLARAFGMKIEYYDIARLTADAEDNLGVVFRLMPEVLRNADIVTVHVPLLPTTRDLISTAELGYMKPTGILINTSRGPVVDEVALFDALSSKRIGGAGLDVLVKEPATPDNPLFALKNVVLTPHQAGAVFHNAERALRNAYDNVQRSYRGETPSWIIPELRNQGNG